MRTNELPEEKLLGVIRNQQSFDASQNDLFKRKRSLFLWTKRLRKLFSSRSLAFVLSFTSLLMLVSLLVILSWDPLEEIAREQNDYLVDASEALEEKLGIADLDLYTKLAKEKNIFKLVDDSSALGSDNADFADLVLLGVITEEPMQAIIKDVKTQNTHFLELGDSVSGMKISDISEGKVKIDYEGKIIELDLKY